MRRVSKKEKPSTTARNRRKRKIRAKLSGTGTCPRLTVFRSNTAIYAQMIDDQSGKTIGSVSTASLKDVKNTVDGAKAVGKAVADILKQKSISNAVFDRNGYLYHGKIKALAEGAREGGLKI